MPGCNGCFTCRPSAVPVQDLVGLATGQARLIVAIYGDNTLRVWDIGSQKRVFFDTLLPEPLRKSLIARTLRVGPQIAAQAKSILAVQFDPSGNPEAESLKPQVGFGCMSHVSPALRVLSHTEVRKRCDSISVLWFGILQRFKKASHPLVTKEYGQARCGLLRFLTSGSPHQLLSSSFIFLEDRLWSLTMVVSCCRC